ncbi:MAG TPA: AMP-binding protein [Acidimicrobiales bacterium]|nr:AMP-binding protein [Acidimicrobiales bacterium]
MGLTDHLQTLGAIRRTGLLAPIRPDRALRLAREAGRWGQTAAAAVAMSAIRHPNRTAIVDDAGRLTWDELDRRTNALARGLQARLPAVDGPPVVGLLARNHRGFVEGLIVAAKLGTDAVLLNTGFAGRQLGEVSRREGVTVLLHDADLGDVVADAGLAGLTVLPLWPDGLAGSADDGPLATPPQTGSVVILSSGTTGTPKGAKRDLSSSGDGRRGGGRSTLGSSIAMLSRIPVRGGETTLISAPLFHSWGLSHALLCAAFASPMVLRPKFDPEDVLATIERERPGTYIAVPAMLQRILALPEDVRARYDTSSLRAVALSGSALPGGLATRWMDAFGDHLHSLYGSTEVAAVSIAGPADLRAAPDTAGPIVPGVDVRFLNPSGRTVPAGQTGRIFVRSGLLFEGYTGGGTKEVIDGYMSTGDVGHLDGGRLFVDGREDDMIVSGGENVFPQEVEEAILDHPAVAEAAVVGVADEEFGQRLRAVIVAAPGGVRPTADDIRDHVRTRLARYKVPRDVVFRDELPRNTTGKVLRRVLVDEAG